MAELSGIELHSYGRQLWRTSWLGPTNVAFLDGCERKKLIGHSLEQNSTMIFSANTVQPGQ